MRSFLAKLKKNTLCSLNIHIHNSETAFSLSILGILLVGLIDYISGIEIRAFPLYFFPLSYTSWFYGKSSRAYLLSALASLTWVISTYLAGRTYSQLYIWGINFISQGSAFLFVSLLVSSLRSSLKREQSLSRIDTLTNLANSRSFYEQASIVLALCHRHSQSVVLAYVDLDNFKQVNDTLGHFQGDSVLVKTAEVFINSLRASDIKARLGGDEFVILLPNTTLSDAQITLERISHQLSQISQFHPLSVTASIGAVFYKHAPCDIEAMLKEADKLMYSVKSTSKNRVLIKSSTFN
ncbi:GGDEF domain-containing protein [bacterium]|nr:GGDEF domain-containing protein [bacterium]